MALKLTGEISLDGSGFEAGLNKIHGAAERVGETLKGLALSAVGIYGIEQAIDKTIKSAEQLVKSANQLGIGIEAFQEFGFAARESGSNVEALTRFIEKLNETRVDPKKFAAYARLGITAPNQGDITDLLMQLNANLRNRSPQSFAHDLREVGGKEMRDVIPLLRSDMAALREEAHRLGQVMRTEDAVMLKFVADEMQVLSQVMVVQLAPALVLVAQAIAILFNSLKGDIEFWKSFIARGGAGATKELLGSIASSPIAGARSVLDAVRGGGYHRGEGLGGKSRGMAALDDFLKIWTAAGASGESTALEGMEDFARMRDRLLERQRMLERIGKISDFVPIADEGDHSKKGSLYSDSLTRIGNFLGSNSNPMVNIGNTHTRLLSRIAVAIEKRNQGGQEPAIFPGW